MKNIIRLFYIFTMLTLTVLTGCAQEKPVPMERDSTLKKIQKSAAGIHNELKQLNQIQIKTEGQRAPILSSPTTGPLSEKVTLRWAGPITGVTEMLADMIGFKFETLGTPPARDKIVNLNAMERPAFDVLQDIGWQAGEKIGLVVDEQSRVIKLAYMGS